jgi:hypothetical protein
MPTPPGSTSSRGCHQCQRDLGIQRVVLEALDVWEQVTGRRYEQALPGGESDARNRDAVQEIISGLLRLWDSLAARNALPEELYVVELGVGNGSQAKTWLDEFVELDRNHGKDQTVGCVTFPLMSPGRRWQRW